MDGNSEGLLQADAGDAGAGDGRVRRSALRLWNIGEALITLLKMRENAVFRIDVPQRASFVMRIHRYDYHSDRDLLSELQWLQALARSGIEAPSIVHRPMARFSK